jgi:hypothetical protein
VNTCRAEGVLLTGVYGSGKSSVAREIAYLLEQRVQSYALLDLDYLSWAGTGTDRPRSRIRVDAAESGRSGGELLAGRDPAVCTGLLRSQPRRDARRAGGSGVAAAGRAPDSRTADIERRLAGDVTSGRPDDLREAAASIAVAEGAGVEDVAISNDRPIGVVARDVMTFLGWL